MQSHTVTVTQFVLQKMGFIPLDDAKVVLFEEDAAEKDGFTFGVSFCLCLVVRDVCGCRHSLS